MGRRKGTVDVLKASENPFALYKVEERRLGLGGGSKKKLQAEKNSNPLKKNGIG